MDRIPRYEVLGVQVSAIDPPAAIAEIERWTSEEERHYVCVTGVHGVMESQRDPVLREIHNASGLTTPDGMPLVWAGRWARAPQVDRVYGPDLMLAVMGHGLDRGWSHFLYGGGDGVPELLALRLRERFPGLRIVGTHSPPFRPLTDEERDSVEAMIDAAAPTFVWVGLSTPKQEYWMAEFRPRLAVPVLVGVGAAFDMHAGLLPQAPRWMQRSGLEWSYRLAREPRRLWRRYLRNNPAFLVRILREPPRMRV